jgi:phosphomevalonate kinase
VITSTAPGKLFLTGEWAVLRGAPALVAAVDRVVRVELRPESALTVESTAERRIWTGEAGSASREQGDVGAVVAVWRRLGAVNGRVTIDSRTFLIGERKLGLGRSAAAIAAAVVACRTAGGLPVGRDAVLADALAANATFQEGQGSGADVAAAVYGGVVIAEPRDGALAVERHALPDGLHLLAGWTGASAATTPLVAAFADMPAPPALADLTATSRAAAAALAGRNRGRLCDAIDRAGDLLVRFGEQTGLPIVTPALARLVDVARRAGAVAKPSGAGGGDCGIALAPTPSIAAAVRAAWRDAGILPLDVTVARDGAALG